MLGFFAGCNGARPASSIAYRKSCKERVSTNVKLINSSDDDDDDAAIFDCHSPLVAVTQ